MVGVGGWLSEPPSPVGPLGSVGADFRRLTFERGHGLDTGVYTTGWADPEGGVNARPEAAPNNHKRRSNSNGGGCGW
ncbi:hypothetical protein GCM10009837_49210 [Streptomyces durmitorensis]